MTWRFHNVSIEADPAISNAPMERHLSRPNGEHGVLVQDIGKAESVVFWFRT
jgi:hypothetical protein